MRGPTSRPALVALAPAAVVVATLLAAGVLVPLLEAFRDQDEGRLFTIDHVAAVLGASGFLASFALTVWVSLASTALTVVLAVVTALALRRMRRLQRFVTLVYQLPLTIPHMVLAVAAIMLVSQSGLLSRVLTVSGLIGGPAQFPELVYDRRGVGIILVYVWKQVPFVGLIALSVLQTVGEDYEAVARTHGAGPLRTIRHVLVPLVMPGLLPAGVIVFAFVFGAFEVPLLLGARYPSMLSVLAYRLYADVDLTLRPQAMALSFLIAVVVLTLAGVYRTIAGAERESPP